MAECAVLASGSGSNFEAVARSLEKNGHRVCCLVTDNDKAYAIVRAQNLNIPWHVAPYETTVPKDIARRKAEETMAAILAPYSPALVVLAGFMRLLTPFFIDLFTGRIVNIHPSLLPKYPGAKGIEESYKSGDNELGITIHLVDYGLDSGPILMQKSFTRSGGESLKEIEERIHGLEHLYYPSVIMNLLNDYKK